MSLDSGTGSHLAALSLVGLRAVDASGEHVGEVDAIMVDREDGTVQWVQVRLPGHHGGWLAVPFRGITVSGGRVVVPHERSRLLEGPRVPGDGSLSSRLERELCAFFSAVAAGRAAGISAWERRRTASRLAAAGAWEPEPRGVAHGGGTALAEAPERHEAGRAADAGR